MEAKLTTIFENTNDWLKFAEAKSASLIALNGLAVFGILRVIKDIQLSDVMTVYVYAAIAQISLSALISLASLIPSLEMPWLFKKQSPNPSDNILYFEHIAKHSEESYLAALSKACEVNDRSFTPYERMLADQIITNSVIARRKFKLFKASLWLLVSGIATPVGAIVVFEVR